MSILTRRKPETPPAGSREPLIHNWLEPRKALCGYTGPKALRKPTYDPDPARTCVVCLSLGLNKEEA